MRRGEARPDRKDHNQALQELELRNEQLATERDVLASQNTMLVRQVRLYQHMIVKLKTTPLMGTATTIIAEAQAAVADEGYEVAQTSG